MVRKFAWAGLTATVVLGLLWAAHSFLPGIGGLDDLNNVSGIGSLVCAVITLMLFLVSRQDTGAVGPPGQTTGGNPVQQTVTRDGHAVQTGGDNSPATVVTGPGTRVTVTSPPPPEETGPTVPGWVETAVPAHQTDAARLGAH
ncbi:hypothetical protein ACFQZ2_05815, partial [Streptomonospora algeriensis]